MRSTCFIIPVKIDRPSHSFYIHRCLASIRRLYPETPIVLALSKETPPIKTDHVNVTQVENPYFSTLGCLSLFSTHKYADYAYILHDSMVLTKVLPPTTTLVSFVYTFHEPGMEAHIYGQNYQKILSPEHYRRMVTTQTTGCFGVSVGIDHRVIESIGILPLLPKITTKNDFCATERIFAYLCDSNNVVYDSLCGTIFGEGDPWAHPELSTMTLDEILARNYTMCVVKSLVGRTE
jgi:hypothetical protein